MDWRDDRAGGNASEDRVQFLADVDLLATAVEDACRELDPFLRRVSIDVLGNADAFVHAHIWPRYEWEPRELVWRPVWLYDLGKNRTPTRRSAISTMTSERASVAICAPLSTVTLGVDPPRG
ncbi:diadenosine tetraphosphate (Ap4A) HIT family hydrolase [Microbacterium sp. AK009]|uniref:hypothetical protein n=1 Tax=Microbacterium sp. AK009 TaxID=2723068 RepID=UPI0015C774C9|nr:hypothetical protein [Microbacterium sp. AK009]NYF17037.1 diadenosine tetraphosphate (Ap4A) HIT family hydrolase [Microbacterium sp. AK009]